MRYTKGFLVKRGSKYHAIWNADGHRYTRSTGTSSHKDALAKLKEWVQPFEARNRISVMQEALERARSTAGVFTQTGITFAVAWQSFLSSGERPDPIDATLANYKAAWDRLAKWSSDHSLYKLADLSRLDANAYATHLRASVTASTANRHIRAIRMVYRVLCLPSDPFEAIQSKRVEQIGRRPLTLSELTDVISKSKGELRTALIIGIYTGLRLGDVATLKWDEVDIPSGLIRRIPSKTRRKGVAVVIPLHPELLATLKALGRRQGHVLPSMATLYRKDASAVSKAIRGHLRSCGIATTVDRDKGRKACVVGFHSLRHSFVSLLRGANAPLSVAESLVGHTNPEMTRLYTHTGNEASATAINSLPSLLYGSKLGSSQKKGKKP